MYPIFSKGRNKVVTSVTLDPELYEEVKMLCSESGVPLSRLVNEVLKILVEVKSRGRSEELVNSLEHVLGRKVGIIRSALMI